MKWLKRIVIGIFLLLALASLALVVTGNSHLFKGIGTTYLMGKTGPAIDEQEIFENRKVEAGEFQPWDISTRYNSFSIPKEFLAEMEQYDPVAFLIVYKDSILLEKYWESYDENTLSNSFSMAKTIISILTCIAIDEGKITSADQKVGDFIPQFREGMNSELTIRHLLSMSSGINFDESYGDPFGFMAKAYYGKELEELTLKYEVTEEPGSTFKYLGGNTILLSVILKEATGMTVSEYCSEKLWKPIGAKNDAFWNLDQEDGIEKAYCCFYSNARDFARIGKLFLHQGNWEGQQLIDSALVKEALTPLTLKNENVDYYGWQWWVGNYNAGPFFYARGILGQYIIVVPELEMVIVRLGHRRSETVENNHIQDVFDYQDLAIGIAKALNHR